MRFEREMQEIAWNLESRYGLNVLQCVYSPPGMVPSEMEKEALAKAHYRKFDLSDAIYVVDIGDYIGESVRREITYARKKGKAVLLHSQFGRE